jgi:crotonobetainyl-CoA:carnitine CoA-transferase CaiB-like acyl-CoA transferase
VNGPLAGIRVVDFGQYVAGPLAAMLLADHGADVIRVDPPGGPRWDVPANATWNRGKQSICLDLKQSSDLDVARSLVGRADVVIEGFRPGVMDRLGLGSGSMLAEHDRLIYCSIPGFAADDPRAGQAGWEGIVGAATATYRPPMGSPAGTPPAYTAIQISSHFAGIQAALAIVMALIARQRDGVGQRIEMPLFDATFAAIGAHGLLIDGAPAGGRPDDFWGGLFECSDGRWVFYSGSTPRFRRRLVELTGNQELEAEGLLDIPRLTREPELAAKLRSRLRALFAGRPAAEWESLGGGTMAPITLCRSAAEWVDTPHARQAGVVQRVVDPRLGPMWQPGHAVRLSDWPASVIHPAPIPDADRANILSELALPAVPQPGRTAAPPSSPVLDGLRVVDLSQVLAGPTTGRTLAEYGADVVKINNPREEGAGYRTSVHRYHTDVNRGKDSILLDIRAPAGRYVLERLVADADVFLQNFRLGVPERLGIGYEQIRALRPDIVYVSVSAFGHAGPWGSWPGYEPNGQATTGLQERFGRGGMPLMQPFAVNDYGTGLLGALGAAMALFHRGRTGRGQQVEAALAFTGTLLQSTHLHAYAGRDWSEPAGRDARGDGPHHRMYQASDGWLFVAAPSGGSALAAALGLASSNEAMEEVFARASVEYWIEALTTAGITAQPVVTSLPALMTDAWVVEPGLAVTREHDTGEHITTVGPGVRLSRTPVIPGRPASTPGADAVAVLSRVGLKDELESLQRDGVVLVEPPRGR